MIWSRLLSFLLRGRSIRSFTGMEYAKALEAVKKILENLRGVEGTIHLAPMGAFVYGSCFIDYFAGYFSGRELEKGARRPKGGKQYKKFIQKFMLKYDAHKLYTDLRCKLVHDFAFNGSYAYSTKFKSEAGSHLKKGKIILPNGKQTEKTLLVAENFLEDIDRAAQKYITALENNESDLRAKAIMRYKLLGSYDGDAKWEKT